ncbi:LRP1 [Mytilus coruscus]|uniref:LRP1 n=1 Tax=Mytilus coruscus TaxID=42192 RepID=A0A6J8E448_MYTCO|nr:LRP1 [Mytilus coruscus]
MLRLLNTANPCDRVYCFNGGTCVVNEYDWSTKCKCRQGYTGRSCYRKASVSVSVTRTSCTCFVGQGNSCFFVPDSMSSWGDAQDYCGNFGAIIWEPDNQASSSVQTLLGKDTSYWTGVNTDYSCKAITWTTGYYSQWKLVDKSCTANLRFVCEKRNACGKQTSNIQQSTCLKDTSYWTGVNTDYSCKVITWTTGYYSQWKLVDKSCTANLRFVCQKRNACGKQTNSIQQSVYNG